MFSKFFTSLFTLFLFGLLVSTTVHASGEASDLNLLEKQPVKITVRIMKLEKTLLLIQQKHKKTTLELIRLILLEIQQLLDMMFLYQLNPLTYYYSFY
ncbi:hypothetical protein [Virgibacillus pantothenticus]|uniref:hypothetical protein n=1 Tax=Virgibacillus pantothenticus TaxID=1473 RepID=UPI000984879F|nr:hypothetical protein [Virgibacillus pantothenticus]